MVARPLTIDDEGMLLTLMFEPAVSAQASVGEKISIMSCYHLFYDEFGSQGNLKIRLKEAWEVQKTTNNCYVMFLF